MAYLQIIKKHVKISPLINEMKSILKKSTNIERFDLLVKIDIF